MCRNTYRYCNRSKGCILTENFVITEPAQEIIDNVTIVDENCFNDCSGSITITDASAVEYSIDNASGDPANPQDGGAPATHVARLHTQLPADELSQAEIWSFSRKVYRFSDNEL